MQRRIEESLIWRRWSRSGGKLNGKGASSALKVLSRSGILHPSSAKASDYQAIMDGLGFGGVDSAALFMAGAHLWGAWQPLLASGHKHAGIARSKRSMLAIAATEEDAGSDVYSIATTAKETARGWALQGRKVAVTNAFGASHCLVFTKGKAERSLNCFLVDLKSTGLALRRPTPWIGLSGSDVGELNLRNVSVPHSALLGEQGAGAELFRIAMMWERSLILAPFAGVLQRLKQQLFNEVKDNRRGGILLRRQDLFEKRMNEIAEAIDHMRERIASAAANIDEGKNPLLSSIQAKLEASSAYQRASLALLEISGKRGFRQGSVWEKNYRDSLLSYLYSGPNDLLKDFLERLK